MVLSMAHCIGKAGCDGKPDGGRGLCRSCYSLHRHRGTLDNFPTMRERTATLRSQNMIPDFAKTRVRDQHRTAAAVAHVEANRRYRELNYAARILVGGVLVHPIDRHGHLTTYNVYGCRGSMCRASQSNYRHTGNTALPEALRRSFTAIECVNYYPSVQGQL